MNEKNQIKLFRDPLDPRELDFSSRNPSHTGSCNDSGTGHTHSVSTCRHDSEGPTTLWLCGHEPFSTPVSSPDNQPRVDEKTKQNLDSDPKKLARANDPATSKAAAKTVKTFANTHHSHIYGALRAIGNGTFYDIAKAADMEPSSVWRRLNELQRAGHIEPTGEERKGPTGRLCRVWRLKGL